MTKQQVPAKKVLAGLIAARQAVARMGWTQQGFITDKQGNDVHPLDVLTRRRK